MGRLSFEQGTPEWHQWRHKGVGSSDIAKIMGISPFGTAMDVFNEKAGFKTQRKINYAMSMGIEHEPISRDKFNKLQNARYKPQCFTHDEFDYFIASVDGWDEYTNTIIEIKTPGKKDLNAAWRQQVPEHYVAQVQWQLYVSGLERAYFICYDVANHENVINTIHRDSETIDKLAAAAHQFWNDFTQGVPPPAQKKDKDQIINPECCTAVQEYIDLKTRCDLLAIELDKKKEKILSFAKDQTFTAYGVTVTKTEPRTTYDVQSMKSDGINISKYAKSSAPGWRITIDK